MNLRLLTVAACLLLAGCLFTPGKFTSTLDIDRDQRFRFAYQGEIWLSTDEEAQKLGTPDEAPVQSCKDEEDKPRACTADEKAEWDAQQKAQAADKAKQKAEAARMFGFDPDDDSSMRAFAADMMKQQGWRKVDYLGKGRFLVDYAIDARLDRDFVWPVYPKMDMVFPLVVIKKRADGAVQVTAPGYANAGPLGPAMAQGLNPMTRRGGKAEGSFTLTTAASVATNNTDDGPQTVAGRTRLSWSIGPMSNKAPEALIRF